MKKLYNLSAILISLFFFSEIHAQNIDIGIRGGISIPNLSSGGSQENPLNTGYSSRLGPDLGIFADIKISNVFSLRPMVEYSSQGGEKDGLQAFPVPEMYAAYFPPGMVPAYLYADFKSEVKLNYLMIPVLAKFGWKFNSSSPFGIYVDAGPFVGFLLSGKQVLSGSSIIYSDASGQNALTQSSLSFDSTNNVKSQLNTVNFGVEGNAGITNQLGKGNIFIEGGFNYGFINIQKGEANGKNNTGAATVTLGYTYPLGKKK